MRSARLIVIALMMWVSAAHGAIIFSSPQPNYTLHPKESVVVPLSLEFTGSDAADLAAHGGLLSAAFGVVRTGTPLFDPVTPTTLVANTIDFNDPVLTPILLGPSPTRSGIWEFADLTRSSGVLGQSSDPNSRAVALGQVTFTAGSDLGQTTFQVQAYDPTLQTTVTFDSPSITLDGSIAPALVTFQVVPEPHAGLVLIVIASMLALWRGKTTCAHTRPVRTRIFPQRWRPGMPKE